MTATIESTLTIDLSGIIIRPLIGLVVALAVTTGLFWTMQSLIEINVQPLNEETTHAMLEFVRIKRDEEIEPDRIWPDLPPLPEPPPIRPTPFDLDDPTITGGMTAIPEVPVDPQIITGNSFDVYEGDYLPIVKVAPIYPRSALSRGIQGYCVIEYTITRQGTIRDPKVIDSQCTSSLFHQVSVDAALKFKYKPRVIDGEALEVSAVQNKFTFQITD